MCQGCRKICIGCCKVFFRLEIQEPCPAHNLSKTPPMTWPVTASWWARALGPDHLGRTYTWLEAGRWRSRFCCGRGCPGCPGYASSCSSYASSSCLPFIYHQSKATHLCLTIPNNHQSKPAIAISPPIFVQELLRPEREIDCLVDVGSMSDHPQMTNGSTHRSMFVGGGSTFRRFGVFFRKELVGGRKKNGEKKKCMCIYIC